MTRKPPILTPRLSSVADLIPKCRCFADIGTDHAYLPVFLCMTEKCDTAIASDIRKGPLSRAEKTLADYDMQSRISLRLGSGLDTIEADEADAVSIAGMGGLIIAQILENGQNKLCSTRKIILQPMTAVPELREFLWKNGWTIDSEHLAIEGDKIYNILTVSLPNGNPKFKPSDIDLYVGKYLLENRPDGFDTYIKQRMKKLMNIIEGLRLSKSANAAEQSEQYRELLNEIEKSILH